MKNFRLASAGLFLFSLLISFNAFSQAPDTIINPRINSGNPLTQNEQYYNARYYKWERPVFQVVDIDRLLSYKSDNQAYLAEVKSLETLLKRNKQELNSYQKQVKDQNTVLKNELKTLNEKRKFYAEDEKILKHDEKLYNAEQKLIRKERKELKKTANEMSSWQMDDRLQKLNDREYRLQINKDKRSEKREITK